MTDLRRYQDPAVMRRALREARTVAVVGLSSKPHRPSYGVAAYLQRQGYRIVPVNPNETEVLGETAYADLRDVPDKIDIVDVFRAADALPEVARAAVEIGADVLWTQFDVVDLDAARLAADAGLDVVMDRCIKVEHAMAA